MGQTFTRKLWKTMLEQQKTTLQHPIFLTIHFPDNLKTLQEKSGILDSCPPVLLTRIQISQRQMSG